MSWVLIYVAAIKQFILKLFTLFQRRAYLAYYIGLSSAMLALLGSEGFLFFPQVLKQIQNLWVGNTRSSQCILRVIFFAD